MSKQQAADRRKFLFLFESRYKLDRRLPYILSKSQEEVDNLLKECNKHNIPVQTKTLGNYTSVSPL